MKLPAILVLGSIFVATPALGDAIHLRASVRLPRAASVVRLADVADLDGDRAKALGDTVVAEITDPTSIVRLSVDDIRSALDAAGVHWGLVNLNGRSVVVRPRAGGAGTVSAMTTAAVTGDAPLQGPTAVPIEIVAAHADDDTTLRGAVAREMVRRLGVPGETLRLSFDADDRDLLARTSEGVRFELTPESSAASDRVTFTVRVWRDGRVETQTQLSLRPLLQRPIAVLRRDVDRNATVTADDLERSVAWLPPTQASLACDPATAADRIATHRLRAGETLRERDVQRRTIVERGDRVIVRCLVGGVAISLQAEARADGGEGESIEFRKLGERDTFLATVTGPGEAVVDFSTP